MAIQLKRVAEGCAAKQAVENLRRLWKAPGDGECGWRQAVVGEGIAPELRQLEARSENRSTGGKLGADMAGNGELGGLMGVRLSQRGDACSTWNKWSGEIRVAAIVLRGTLPLP